VILRLSDITFHHTLITINLSNLPTIAFLAGILRLRLQPGVIPLGPKVWIYPAFRPGYTESVLALRYSYSYRSVLFLCNLGIPWNWVELDHRP
jgi:hypothetical protein